jgi:hypothetical protein
MTIANVLTVVSMFLAPLFALQVSRALDRRRERRDRRLSVFRTLMATRARKVCQEHVEALNVIDVEFGERTSHERAVLDAWKLYLDHLNRPAGADEAWGEKREELFIDLLYKMAVSLGYDFDKVHIRNQSYLPRAHGELESDQMAIRKGVLSLLQGQSALAIHAVEKQAPALLRLPEGQQGVPAKLTDVT